MAINIASWTMDMIRRVAITDMAAVQPAGQSWLHPPATLTMDDRAISFGSTGPR